MMERLSAPKQKKLGEALMHVMLTGDDGTNVLHGLTAKEAMDFADQLEGSLDEALKDAMDNVEMSGLYAGRADSNSTSRVEVVEGPSEPIFTIEKIPDPRLPKKK